MKTTVDYSAMVPKAARQAVETYKAIQAVRRELRKQDLPEPEMTPEESASELALHQNAQMVWLFDSGRELRRIRCWGALKEWVRGLGGAVPPEAEEPLPNLLGAAERRALA